METVIYEVQLYNNLLCINLQLLAIAKSYCWQKAVICIHTINIKRESVVNKAVTVRRVAFVKLRKKGRRGVIAKKKCQQGRHFL